MALIRRLHGLTTINQNATVRFNACAGDNCRQALLNPLIMPNTFELGNFNDFTNS